MPTKYSKKVVILFNHSCAQDLYRIIASFFNMYMTRDNPKIRLTNNDKKVLHYLIEQGRVSDSYVAKKLKVTRQALL